MAVYFGFTWGGGLARRSPAPRDPGDPGNPRACGSSTRTSRGRAEHPGDQAALGARPANREIKRECAVISGRTRGFAGRILGAIPRPVRIYGFPFAERVITGGPCRREDHAAGRLRHSPGARAGRGSFGANGVLCRQCIAIGTASSTGEVASLPPSAPGSAGGRPARARRA